MLILTRVEVSGRKMSTGVYPIFWILTGVLIYKISLYLRGSGSAIRKSILGLALAIYVFGTFFLALKFLMCGDQQAGPKYVSVKEHDLFLECRFNNCSQTASRCQFTTVRTLVSNVYWVTKIDSSKVDLNKWKPLPEDAK